MADNSQAAEEPGKNERAPEVEAPPTTLEPASEAEPQPKRKPGRPLGAKDGQKRKTPVRRKIVVEPLQAPEPEPAPAAAPSAPVRQAPEPVAPEPVPYEPPSPGTLKRYHRDELFRAERLEREEKRRRIQESIVSRLHVFPR